MTQSVNQKERPCTIYIEMDEQSQLTSQEIQKTLESGKVEEKIKALKSLILQLIHDDSFPKMILTIFNFVLPTQTENHSLKKILLYYWEIVDKLNPDGTIKDEIILVCHSLRTDLLHPNEYIRGRTLRLLSKVMIKSILEPLIPSILENLKHKHSYVRRNAVSCLYMIFLNFQNDLVPDVDEYIEELLRNENDLSTKRNAFMLLYNSNLTKGINYISNNILNDVAEDAGDIMQLAVLELLRKSCKVDPSQKSKLMKAIISFSNSKSSSVLFECANTLTQISTAPTVIKLAINIYIQLLCGNSDNNVKLIVLEKFHHLLRISPKLLEEQLLDITKVLSNHDSDIRKKTLDLIKALLRQKNILTFFPILKKELRGVVTAHDPTEVEYRGLLLSNLEYCVQNFQEVAEDAVDFLNEYYLSQPKLDDNSTKIIASIICDVMERYLILQQSIVKNCTQRIGDIQSTQILKVILWSIGEYLEDRQNILEALDNIKKEIGGLPFELEKKSSETGALADAPKTRTRTIILADGSYGTEVVVDAPGQKKQISDEGKSFLRTNLLSSSFFASSVVVTLLKLLYRIRDETQYYNLHASQILMILIGLLKFYNVEEAKTDPELISKLTIGIKLITNPKIFTHKKFSWLEREGLNTVINGKRKELLNKKADVQETAQQQEAHLAKQPDDLIVIRQLKGKSTINDIDLSDEEVNDVLLQKGNDRENEEYTTKLKKIVQLTGYSDPIYAEAIVDIHKYDINFEILLINRTNKTLQNISVEFSTQGDLRIIDKPQQVTLSANQSTSIKTGLKLVSSEAGLIFASINFENTAGISQGYMITNEIQIDLIEFIFPGEIKIDEFRQLWSKYEWENKVIVNTHIEDPIEFIKMISKELKMYILNDLSRMEESAFFSVNLYAKTKLDDDFLMNVSLEKSQGKVVGFIRLRGKSKVKGIIVLLGEKLKQIQTRRQ